MFNVLQMPEYPCTKDCTARCENCKATCKKHKKFLKIEKEAHKNFEKNKKEDMLLRGFFKDQIESAVYGK